MQDSNEATALEACEFWLALAENPQVCKETLLPHLPKLIPVLVRCMRYSDVDVAVLKVSIQLSSITFGISGYCVYCCPTVVLSLCVL